MSKKLISVSTKTGDKGTSGLISGRRISKSSISFEVLGTLDELNSHLGLVVVKLKQNYFVDSGAKKVNQKSRKELLENAKFVLEIQNTLFYLGAQLAESSKQTLKNSDLEKLEKEANRLQIKMADNWITKFVLPGGTELGAMIDIARTVSRRLERLVVKLAEEKFEAKIAKKYADAGFSVPIPPLVFKYINRLSDYLFILRCFVNDKLSADEKLFETTSK